ncbi:tRNA (adenosine(37)-N6)-dimethylallyltransferase MiaA [Leptolyngbya sp. 7M]|uniref:tRNA (adenosine(37)-N6)-dimethylallyltransferase MiaA n=1 Tax=Leptolyngbya sp. 7M TaxID=2812896 RepID=UPI001B8D8463|nr:tRNA (adenosine(37)-N6)-dimethylallyltransferase MiaA [Leptolyngbya sp. 7M]QYO66012.1 tRNA (adenosine(37)-N6)-dimethylallyltransferase MiaA [Leptolyngbya sp. 7M]
MIRNDKPIFAISGPTCSGKTALGVRLAKYVGGEVINFDSVQIYQKIRIATAKPSIEEMEGIPHHLIDYVDPNIKYTAADWARDATNKILEIESRAKVPILVGGTGFYLRTLRVPLFDSPKTDPALRQRLQAMAKSRGVHHLYRMLRRLDPAAAEKLFPNDSVRVIRALEVFFQTGEPISKKQPNRSAAPEFSGRIRLFVLHPPREILYQKINSRTRHHFQNGLVNEVMALLNEGISPEGSALGAHGYRRVCEYLRGERSLESAIEKTQQDVRNYAKRQLTWFRREKDAIWLYGFGTDEDIWEKLKRQIRPAAM